MKKYMLTLRIPFETVDDLSARERARFLLAMLEPIVLEHGQDPKSMPVGAKLQEVFPVKAPRKVSL